MSSQLSTSRRGASNVDLSATRSRFLLAREQLASHGSAECVSAARRFGARSAFGADAPGHLGGAGWRSDQSPAA
ncbi:MAG TPA: hypothetical protein VI318_21270 [Baekduia sp.]